MFRFLSLLLLCSLALSSSLKAMDGGKVIQSKLIDQDTYFITFARSHDLTPNQFILRFIQPVAMSGCITVDPLGFEMKKNEGRLDIEVKPAKIKTKDAPFQTHCNEYIQDITGGVVLNIDNFVNEQIKSLTIKSPLGQDRFTITAHENRIELKPSSAGIFKPYISQNRKTPLIHWFYPKGTLILSAPAAPEDVSAQLKAVALEKGFTEIETRLDGFNPPTKTPNTLYVIDETMAVASTIKPDIQSPIGHVEISETLRGPDGPYDVPKKIDVLARIPGSVE